MTELGQVIKNLFPDLIIDEALSGLLVLIYNLKIPILTLDTSDLPIIIGSNEIVANHYLNLNYKFHYSIQDITVQDIFKTFRPVKYSMDLSNPDSIEELVNMIEWAKTESIRFEQKYFRE